MRQVARKLLDLSQQHALEGPGRSVGATGELQELGAMPRAGVDVAWEVVMCQELGAMPRAGVDAAWEVVMCQELGAMPGRPP